MKTQETQLSNHHLFKSPMNETLKTNYENSNNKLPQIQNLRIGSRQLLKPISKKQSQQHSNEEKNISVSNQRKINSQQRLPSRKRQYPPRFPNQKDKESLQYSSKQPLFRDSRSKTIVDDTLTRFYQTKQRSNKKFKDNKSDERRNQNDYDLNWKKLLEMKRDLEQQLKEKKIGMRNLGQFTLIEYQNLQKRSKQIQNDLQECLNLIGVAYRQRESLLEAIDELKLKNQKLTEQVNINKKQVQK